MTLDYSKIPEGLTANIVATIHMPETVYRGDAAENT